MNAEHLIQSALHHHQAGKLGRAVALYKEVLALDPNNADAWHYLGVIAHQKGEDDRAVTLIGRSTQLNDRNADAFNNLGEAQRGLGQLDTAIRCYEKSIELSPRHVPAHYNLGMTLVASSQATASIKVFENALALAPDDLDICIGFAGALHTLQRLHQAMGLYQHARRLAPRSTDGMTLWNKTVPGDYFDQPGERSAITQALTTASGAIPRTVSYACNRAILFNGNVRHNSDQMHFKNNYLSRRISITFAFGEPER